MRNIVYFDLETQRGEQEVGGWRNIARMGMSVGVTFSTARGTYAIYLEEDIPALVEELRRADLVVGYNVLRFDYAVVEAYVPLDLSLAPTADLMLDIQEAVGHRVSLDEVAESTLGVNKTAKGVDALKWWKQGRVRDIAEYCCYDVKVTRMVHEHGAREGKVTIPDRKTRLNREAQVKWKLD
jgi:DEAD/DEAH box helicase domain-containing protein